MSRPHRRKAAKPKPYPIPDYADMEARCVALMLRHETPWVDLTGPANTQQYYDAAAKILQEMNRNIPNRKIFPSWDPYPILPP